jgi:hypothetical protein
MGDYAFVFACLELQEQNLGTVGRLDSKEMWTFSRDFFALLDRGRVWIRWRPNQSSQISKKEILP